MRTETCQLTGTSYAVQRAQSLQPFTELHWTYGVRIADDKGKTATEDLVLIPQRPSPVYMRDSNDNLRDLFTLVETKGLALAKEEDEKRRTDGLSSSLPSPETKELALAKEEDEKERIVSSSSPSSTGENEQRRTASDPSDALPPSSPSSAYFSFSVNSPTIPTRMEFLYKTEFTALIEFWDVKPSDFPGIFLFFGKLKPSIVDTFDAISKIDAILARLGGIVSLYDLLSVAQPRRSEPTRVGWPAKLMDEATEYVYFLASRKGWLFLGREGVKE